MKYKNILIGLVICLLLFTVISEVAATCNIIVITDPTGQDSNGAAAGSMSFAKNMFQSSFIMSKNNQYAVLSGGEGNSTERVRAIGSCLAALENGASPSDAASVASSFSGIRLLVGGPSIGAAVGGSFDAYVIDDDGSGTISITQYSGGLAVLPPGHRGAIIHLLNSEGNPLFGTATSVRRETAINIAKMIRDGYPATRILGEAMREVATDSGEQYGGGAVNLIARVSTGDMFTPEEMNTTGFPMSENYTKSCPMCGWSVGYPEADSYSICPIDGSQLKVTNACDALINAITVTANRTSVSVYGSDRAGLASTTEAIVQASVNKNGYDADKIAGSINRGIHNGLIMGVNYVEPKDLSVKPESRAVGVYFEPLAEGRTSPPWNLPIDSTLLSVIGAIETAIGFLLLLLVIFRSRLLSNFRREGKNSK